MDVQLYRYNTQVDTNIPLRMFVLHNIYQVHTKGWVYDWGNPRGNQWSFKYDI